MEIKKVNKAEHKMWDAFIDNANNGTIFHKLKFLSYHRPRKFNFTPLAFYKNNELIACLPGGMKDNAFYSPLGSSYGSIVTNNISFSEYEDILDALISYGRKKKFNQISLTPSPICYMKTQNQIEPFLLEYKGFKPNHLITNAVNLNSFEHDTIINQFTNMHKRAIKKALNSGVTVQQSDDIQAFYSILTENKKKFNTSPTHTLEEMKKLLELFPKEIKLFMAYDKESKPIAGILLFRCNNETTLTFYISHLFEYQELRAVNLLFYEVLKWSKENGYNWLDLGVSMDTLSDNPMEPSRSLIYFKEGIQTRGFLRTTYTLNL